MYELFDRLAHVGCTLLSANRQGFQFRFSPNYCCATRLFGADFLQMKDVELCVYVCTYKGIYIRKDYIYLCVLRAAYDTESEQKQDASSCRCVVVHLK